VGTVGLDESSLIEEVSGSGALAEWYFVLNGLARRGLVRWSVVDDGETLVTLMPTSASFAIVPFASDVDRLYLLSRFAYLRREGEKLVLESPQARATIIIEDARVAAMLAGLARPSSARDLADRAGGLAIDAAGLVLGLLGGVGLVRDVGVEGSDPEDESSTWGAWEFHDLLFHARTRKGRTDVPHGATFRLQGKVEPAPAIKPPPSGVAIPLDRPDLARLPHDDRTLAWTVETRRSIREYGERPMSIGQLGEFLFRVGRVKDVRELELETPAGPLRMEFASRPYPSGGGLYELEFSVVAIACEGLEPGLYAYDGCEHSLVLVRGLGPDVASLARDAADAAGIPRETLQVVIVLSARPLRLSWKYASVAYSLILKHVGVVYQSMYLAATAMGLAPCALGSGDSDAFARAAGLEADVEVSVGEFLLGSCRESDSS
jgi:SagB-type dehydrogenase family enzyme